jgi:GT2 family glycosyltransferase
MSSPGNLDVIVVNYRDCGATLAAARRLTPWRWGRLWLVDNSGEPQELAALADHAASRPWVQVLDAQGNLGFGRGCNLAYGRSDAAFVLLLNPDARIAPEDVERLADDLARDARLAAVSPSMYWDEARRFLIPPTLEQTPAMELRLALARRFPAAARARAMRLVARLRRAFASGRLLDVPMLSGAVLLLRRAAVEAAGGLFDPQFFMFFEDADLSARLRRCGCRLAIDPLATAVHEYRHKASKAPLMAEARERYFGKRHPLFHRLSGGLRRLSAGGARDPWGDTFAGTLSGAADFNRLASGGVIAWSPSPVLLPALFRPAGQDGAALSAGDWAALEPGRYMTAVDAGGGRLRFMSFEKR